MLGSTEIIILVILALVLFGASAIPKFARSLGQAKHEFEKGQREKDKAAEGEETDSASQPEEQASQEDASSKDQKKDT
jgi:sec-independent protein translocase protein TatA